MRHFLLLTLLCFSTWAAADDFNYNYGVEGGVNLSKVIDSTYSSSVKERIGIVAGLYWDFFPTNWVSFAPGIYVLGKGYRVFSDPNQAVVLNYIQFRFTGRLPIFSTFSSKLFVDLGPTFEFITQKGTQNVPSPPKLSYVRDSDASLMGGIGFETDINQELRVVFNAKYHYGLLNIFNTSSITINGTTADLPKLNSSGFLFTMALQFSTEKNRIKTSEDRAREFINNKNSDELLE